MVAGKTQALDSLDRALCGVPGVRRVAGNIAIRAAARSDLTDLDWRIRATTSSGSGRSRPPTTSGSATGHLPLRSTSCPPGRYSPVRDRSRALGRRHWACRAASIARRWPPPALRGAVPWGTNRRDRRAAVPAVFVIDERRIPWRYVAGGVAVGLYPANRPRASRRGGGAGSRYDRGPLPRRHQRVLRLALLQLRHRRPLVERQHPLPTPRWPSRSSGCSGGRSTGPWWSTSGCSAPSPWRTCATTVSWLERNEPDYWVVHVPPGCRGRPRPSTTRGSCRPPARARDRAGPGHSNAADLQSASVPSTRLRPARVRASSPRRRRRGESRKYLAVQVLAEPVGEGHDRERGVGMAPRRGTRLIPPHRGFFEAVDFAVRVDCATAWVSVHSSSAHGGTRGRLERRAGHGRDP